ncbi:MAG: MBL fold metallo-hydrolase [Candidatus Omnitrophica bacterium]|nr:MBL fold metallo-hydrolase [Candidatus Omnitrophota bacterium]MDD5770851.1 MBL fold metallo-hydrolase [Candidatus Omnitrophota bacterium]
MSVKIKFLGGAKTVTGSSHLVTAGNTEILLDGGLFQGRRQAFYEINTAFHYNPRTIKAMVLSHAHIDHCGNIPNLIKRGLRCKIYTTSATKDLAALMLVDSGKIQEEDVRYVNKINRRMGLPLRKALYTAKEASKAIRIFRSISYKQKFCIAKDICATILDAGHILGSGIIVLDIKDGQRSLRVGYAVDLGRKNLPLLNDPVVPEGLDYLVMESTYGARLHRPIDEAQSKLREAICRAVKRGGKVIIPSFTLERTQEVIYFLNELLKEKLIPSVPIYVDSPLATNITDLFNYHLDFLNDKTRKAFGKGDNPFELLNLRFIREQKESKALNTDKRPMIIIAGSGMCESGRVLHHLQNNIEDSRNMILVVGYMAQDTLGRRIVEKNPFVRIFGVEYELNAEVVVINSFSGHADQRELLEFVSGCTVSSPAGGPLKRIFLVHGELEQSEALAGLLSQKGLQVHIPDKDEEILLN